MIHEEQFHRDALDTADVQYYIIEFSLSPYFTCSRRSIERFSPTTIDVSTLWH